MTKNSTLFLKGIAIIFMITHHLFWNQGGYGLMIGGVALSQRVGIMGKLCVALFLMLSGYGLYKKYGNEYHYQDQKRRIQSLYLVYWISIAFVVIVGFLCFRNQFYECFQEFTLKDNVKQSFLTILGLQQFVNYQGIIGAWWFVSLILTCYIVHPYLIRLKQKGDFVTFTLLCLCSFLFYYNGGFLYILAYILPFFLGILICKYKLLEKHYNMYIVLCLWILFIGLRLSIVELTKIGYVLEIGISMLFMYSFQNVKSKAYAKPFMYIGNVSAYIFYIHMIFSNYYCSNWIITLKNPILMVLAVLLLSCFFAVLLKRVEVFIKGWLGKKKALS